MKKYAVNHEKRKKNLHVSQKYTIFAARNVKSLYHETKHSTVSHSGVRAAWL